MGSVVPLPASTVAPPSIISSTTSSTYLASAHPPNLQVDSLVNAVDGPRVRRGPIPPSLHLELAYTMLYHISQYYTHSPTLHSSDSTYTHTYTQTKHYTTYTHTYRHITIMDCLWYTLTTPNQITPMCTIIPYTTHTSKTPYHTMPHHTTHTYLSAVFTILSHRTKKNTKEKLLGKNLDILKDRVVTCKDFVSPQF